MRPMQKHNTGLWGITRFPWARGNPLVGRVWGQCWGAVKCLLHHNGGALVQIPTQKRPLPIEGDKPVSALFMRFHFIPPWQPFKQWLWGNVPLWRSNNSQDQQLFCVANTLIKRVKSFLPESIKEFFMKDTCKQEQNDAQAQVFCSKDDTFVNYHN